MKLHAFSLCVFACTACAFDIDDVFDRLDNALTVSLFQDNLRVRLSGTLDLEFYNFEQPAPGLIDSRTDNLFNPRLTLFVDAQLGSQIYFFAQTRVDRGFDPTDQGADIRLDEYAVRITPWLDGRFSLQVGKFATVVGNWVPRHLSWDNPFINAPLVYENVTAIQDKYAPYSPLYFVYGPYYYAKYSFNPVIWAFSGRVGFKPNEAWNFGFSASEGPYFRREAEPTLPPGRDIDDYREFVLGQDASFAWHHLQVWAEFYEARFEVPRVGNADTFAYYIEAKYKFTPQFFGALRWNQQLFGTVSDGYGHNVHWSEDLGRIDVAVTYRFTPHAQLKLQYDFQHETTGPADNNHLFAAQFTVRF
ncbi:MAG: hypothetical protein DMF01_06905 [Verrucomicrobia bacterium]|nr:MAG: hypothetical protein DMF01_06905 [Verrucomicrobiota bacterium]